MHGRVCNYSTLSDVNPKSVFRFVMSTNMLKADRKKFALGKDSNETGHFLNV
jgi:hypothetical protein